MTVSEAAKRWNLSKPRITQLLTAGRIPGASKSKPTAWFIPDNAKKPENLKLGRPKKIQAVRTEA